MRFFFRKNEKLKSEKEIDLLFKNGKSSFIYPIKLIYVTNISQPIECKVLITVSKRYLKNAVDRNLIKRRLREAYRLNAANLKDKLVEKKICASIAFIYTSSKIIPYEKADIIVKTHISNILNILEKRESKN